MVTSVAKNLTLSLVGIALLAGGTVFLVPDVQNALFSKETPDYSREITQEVSVIKIATSRKAYKVNNFKTSYYEHDGISLTGLRIRIESYDEDNQMVGDPVFPSTDDFTYSIEGIGQIDPLTFRFRKVGDFNLTVQYKDKDAIKTNSLNYKLTVNNLYSFNQTLEISQRPTKFEYLVGDKLDLTNVTLKRSTQYKQTENGDDFTKDEPIPSNNEPKFDVYVSGEKINPETYTFNEPGTFEISLGTNDWLGNTLKQSFYVNVSDNRMEFTNPINYEPTRSMLSRETVSARIHITNKEGNSNNVSSDNYYSPSEVSNTYNLESAAFKEYGNILFESYKNHTSLIDANHFVKSTGDVPILVVPVKTTSSDEYSDTTHGLLQRVFFGDTNAINYESLRSYYYKSSFGKLNLTGSIAPLLDCTDNEIWSDLGVSFDFTNKNDQASEVAKHFTDWLNSDKIKEQMKDVDLANYTMDPASEDLDRKLACVFFVPLHEFSEDNTTSSYKLTRGYNKTQATPIEETFSVGNYDWVSLDYLNARYVTKRKQATINGEAIPTDPNEYYFKKAAYDGGVFGDARVAIREFGYLLGLNNYEDSQNLPLGHTDMMDGCNGDLNGYSKLLLNWTTPYIVKSWDVDSDITIHSSQIENNVIILPYNNYEYIDDVSGKKQFNCFDEYILIELYTPYGLNAYGYPLMERKNFGDASGIKAYHVDSRLKVVDSNTVVSINKLDFSKNPFDEGSNIYSIYKAVSNSSSTSEYLKDNERDYDEIRLLAAAKQDYQNQGGVGAIYKNNFSFSVEKKDLVNYGFDDGSKCNYKLTVHMLTA